MQDTVEKTIVINAPKERVYNAIADPEKLAKWFPDSIEGSLAPGSYPILDFGEYGKSKIYIAAADPTDYFAYRWVSGSAFVPQGFLGDVLTMPHTLVEFRLSDVPGGTQVNLKESGFAGLPAEYMAKNHEENNGGWDFMLDRLAKYAQEE